MKESTLMGDFIQLHKPNHSKEVPSELEQMYQKRQRQMTTSTGSRRKMLDHKSSNEVSDKSPTLGVTERRMQA